MGLRHLGLVILLCLSNGLPAQRAAVVDSLHLLLAEDLSDSARVDVYVALAYEYAVSDSVKTAQYTTEAIKLADEIDYPEGAINALNEIGWITMMKGHYKSAEDIYSDMIRRSKQAGYLIGLAKANYAKGIIYHDQGAYSLAMDNYFKALSTYEEADDIEGQANCYNSIGVIHRINGEFDKALDNYAKSQKLKEQVDDTQGMAYSFNNMGVVSFYLGEFDGALDYYFRALELFKSVESKDGIADIYLNVGEVYMELNNLDSSLHYYNQSLKLYKEIDYQAGITYVLIDMGKLFHKKNHLISARKYLREGIQLSQKIGYARNIAEGAKELAEVEVSFGNYKKAYEAQVLYQEMTDSLSNEEITKKLTRLEAQYEFEKEKDSIQYANEKEKLALNQKMRKQHNLQVGTALGLLALFILSAVLYKYYQSKQDSNKKLLKLNSEIQQQRDDLEKLNNAKTRFFSIVAHDIRGPMSILTGYFEILKEHINSKYKEQDEQIDLIKSQMDKSSDQLLNLLDNLLKWAMNEEGLIPYKPDHLEIENCILENNEMLAAKAEAKNIDLAADVNPGVTAWADRNSLMTILRNLTSNALKFTDENGKVELSAYEKGKNIVEINVRDTGVGIPPEKLPSLFDIEDRHVSYGTRGERGTGLGLNIVYDFVKMNKGTISVDSRVGEGTTFTVLLPSHP